MELMNKNVKGLDFPNAIEAWQLHSQNIMLALSSRACVTAEYSNHRSLQVQDTTNKGKNECIDMSMKGQGKEKSNPTNRTKEKIMCHEILALSNTFTETLNMVFDNSTY